METMIPMLPGLLMFMLYSFLMIGLSIFGLVLLALKCGKLTWWKAQAQLPAGTAAKTVYWNVGMVLYILLCAAAIVLTLL